MESSRGDARFFFQKAYDRLDALIEFASKECRHLFPGIRAGGPDAPLRSAGHILQAAINERYKELCWLAGDDPMKMEGYNKMPLLEYFMLLDKKIAEIRKANNKQFQAKT